MRILLVPASQPPTPWTCWTSKLPCISHYTPPPPLVPTWLLLSLLEVLVQAGLAVAEVLVTNSRASAHASTTSCVHGGKEIAPFVGGSHQLNAAIYRCESNGQQSWPDNVHLVALLTRQRGLLR